MNRLLFSRVLIMLTIILVAAFQCYWISRLYQQERASLRREADVLFRDVVYRLQLQRFKSDTTLFRNGEPDNLFAFDLKNAVKRKITDSMLARPRNSKDTNRKSMLISIHTQSLYDDAGPGEHDRPNSIAEPPVPPTMLRLFSGNRMVNDSLPLYQIDTAYKAELSKNNINIDFVLRRSVGETGKSNLPRIEPGRLTTNFTFVGLSNSYAYQAEFKNPFGYLLQKIAVPLLVSLMLVVLTIVSFLFLNRNLLAQKRLANIKNEFISNITHELKTPIATVHAAVEALRNFNAIDDRERTKEYLDISAAELQRLSVLVDKVLRISMFENGEIELKKERFDLKDLIMEVLSVMKLQLDKRHAKLTVTADDKEFFILADRMFITSLLYNLLDNALKYNHGNPEIEIKMRKDVTHVTLSIADNGIGIAAEYRSRIFEKLFRVPTQDVHNTRGHGLGLSFVNHIINRHQGDIRVDSTLGKGTVFTVLLPAV